MTLKSNFVFRIIIGMIFVAQFFYGGRYGQGNIFLLGIGLGCVSYGIFKLIQYNAVMKTKKPDESTKEEK